MHTKYFIGYITGLVTGFVLVNLVWLIMTGAFS